MAKQYLTEKTAKTPRTAIKRTAGKTSPKNGAANKTTTVPAVKKSVKKAPASKAKRVSRKMPLKKNAAASSRTAVVKSPPELVLPPIPDEYRDNRIVSMPVTPRRIYVYWEIPEEKLEKYKGSLNLRVSDVKTNAFFYVPVSGRIGESFININPGSDYTVEAGIIDYKGEFVDIIQQQASAPESHAAMQAEGHPEDIASGDQSEMTEGAKEKGLPEEFFEVPEPHSSY
ncbi:MAG: DUF4912 domain-containing protein [Dissulfurispiraceae bacterium]|jgi:hypothetical protein